MTGPRGWDGHHGTSSLASERRHSADATEVAAQTPSRCRHVARDRPPTALDRDPHTPARTHRGRGVRPQCASAVGALGHRLRGADHRRPAGASGRRAAAHDHPSRAGARAVATRAPGTGSSRSARRAALGDCERRATPRHRTSASRPRPRARARSAQPARPAGTPCRARRPRAPLSAASTYVTRARCPAPLAPPLRCARAARPSGPASSRRPWGLCDRRRAT
jgi:hypothetical protein